MNSTSLKREIALEKTLAGIVDSKCGSRATTI